MNRSVRGVRRAVPVLAAVLVLLACVAGIARMERARSDVATRVAMNASAPSQR